VWFGEELPSDAMHRATAANQGCDVFLSIGTSSQVYPAAGLTELAQHEGAKLIEINPTPTVFTARAGWALAGKAGEILPMVIQRVGANPAQS
jgi:NAD-dependent deacetylase